MLVLAVDWEAAQVVWPSDLGRLPSWTSFFGSRKHLLMKQFSPAVARRAVYRDALPSLLYE